jgi:hypothetical protein
LGVIAQVCGGVSVLVVSAQQEETTPEILAAVGVISGVVLAGLLASFPFLVYVRKVSGAARSLGVGLLMLGTVAYAGISGVAEVQQTPEDSLLVLIAVLLVPPGLNAVIVAVAAATSQAGSESSQD